MMPCDYAPSSRDGRVAERIGQAYGAKTLYHLPIRQVVEIGQVMHASCH